MDALLKKYPVPPSLASKLFSYPDSSLDLHGYSRLESEEKMEWFIRNAVSQKYHTVAVITGVGTGVLRGMVQQFLKQHVQKEVVQKWEEVEDGVFWVVVGIKN